MANYNVDIAVGLKGAQKLTSFNKTVKSTNDKIKFLNHQLKTAAKDQSLFIRSFDNLNETLKKTTANFNAAASGTSLQKKAARELVAAQKDLNKELKIQEQILQGATLTGQRSSLKAGRSRTLLGQSVTPEGGVSGRSRQILSENQELQAALARMDQRDMKLTGQSTNIESKLQQSLATQTANRKQAEKEVAKIRENATKKIEAREKKLILLRKKSLKQEIQDRRRLNRLNQTNVAGPASGFLAFSQRADKITAQANRPGLGQIIGSQFAEGGIFASPGGRSARARGALQSGLIGGGFPLLFGQGGAGAIAGGLGGLAGGALSPGFGFAGSIVATAAAQEIQKVLDFRKQVSELNMEMRSMGISSNISANSITKLGKSLGVTREEAVKVLEQFKRFGEESIGLAKFFGGDFALFESFSQADNISSVLNAIKQSSKDLTMEEELRITRLLTQKGAEAAINELIDVRKKKIIDLKKEQNKKRSTPKGSLVSGLGVGEAVNQSELNILTATTDKTIENLNKIRNNVTEQKLAVEEAGFSIVSEIEKIDTELRKLNNTQFQTIELSKAISSSFEDSFKGIIRGTLTVQDAFRNMLNKIADFFIESAARMAATQFQKGLLGILGQGLASAFSPGSSFKNFGGTSVGTAGQFVGSVKGFPTFADGGRPPVGRASIVGERGPELFVPDRAGTIIPNNGMGGSTNIVVNVDASGSSVEGDEQGGRELGRLISVAIQSELIQQKRPGGLLA